MLRQHVKLKVTNYWIDFDVFKLKAMNDYTKVLLFFLPYIVIK